VRQATRLSLTALVLALTACKGGPGTRPVLPSLTLALELDGGLDGGTVLSLSGLLDAGVDFGTVPVLVPADRTLLLGNIGGTELSVTAVVLLPDGGAFSLLVPTPTVVPSGGVVPLPLSFVAEAQQTYQGSLTIQSDDSQNASIQIPLIGRGSTQGKLEVTPDPIDFGPVGEGTSQFATVTLKSTGTAYLLISDISLAPGTDPAFTIASAVPNLDAGTTTAIDAGDSVQLALQFAPVAGTPIHPDGGFLLIQSSDPNQQPYLSVPLLAQVIGAPVPLIGDPGVVPVGALVTLDGGASYDPGGLYPLTYSWSLTYKPGGSQAQLSDVTVPFPQIVVDRPGPYRLSLNVTNDAGVQSLSPAFATINARPTEDIYVELVWQPHGAPNVRSLVDLDLHFLNLGYPGAFLNGAYDCFWGNRNPGIDGGTFGAICSEDAIVGPGPEWAGYANPANGVYTVAVDYYSTHGQAAVATDATVRIYIYGILAAQLTQELTTVGDTWWVANIGWPWVADGGLELIGVVNDGGTPPDAGPLP